MTWRRWILILLGYPLTASWTAAGHDLDILPNLLGTVTRSPEYVAQKAAEDRNKTRQAICSIAVWGLINSLARSVFQMRILIKTCPKANEDTASHVPGEGATSTQKACMISASAIFASMAQIARSLTVSVSQCGETATVAQACAVSVETILLPFAYLIAGGTVISASCGEAAATLPQTIEPGRRLDARTARSAADRPWATAECAVDALSAARALEGIGISLAEIVRNCPVQRISRFEESISTAACTVDISQLLTSFFVIVFYIASAVNHCSPMAQNDALCLLGVTSILGSISATATGGAALYLSCEVGKKTAALQAGLFAMLHANASNVSQAGKTELDALASMRLSDSAHIFRRLLLREPGDSMTLADLDETWSRLGYNLSDGNASWLHDVENADAEQVLKRGQEIISTFQQMQPEVASQDHVIVEQLSSAVPAVPISLSDPLDTLACAHEGGTIQEVLELQSGLPGRPMKVTKLVSECQARCAEIVGCAWFAFWKPERHCHVLGFLKLSSSLANFSRRVTDQMEDRWAGLWVSGPPGCRDGQISPATLLLAERHRTCYHSHALHVPSDLGSKDLTAVPSILHCQIWCQQVSGCAHFSYSAITGTCYLSSSSSKRLQPVLNFVSGPKHCSSLKSSFNNVSVDSSDLAVGVGVTDLFGTGGSRSTGTSDSGDADARDVGADVVRTTSIAKAPFLLRDDETFFASKNLNLALSSRSAQWERIPRTLLSAAFTAVPLISFTLIGLFLWHRIIMRCITCAEYQQAESQI
eukprot:TRINITY_DN5334_c0_g1_i4.p1 TRINITY_DN5334_c0_g1~~TRINITY_DN5334_c0_g1_i4.p1  ORF type:complete len:765 (+),score=118.06 TRINITY_DN5334_c0_g1_i4:94-2388(+)